MAEVFLPDGAGSLSGVAHVIVRLPFVFGIIIRCIPMPLDYSHVFYQDFVYGEVKELLKGAPCLRKYLVRPFRGSHLKRERHRVMRNARATLHEQPGVRSVTHSTYAARGDDAVVVPLRLTLPNVPDEQE